MFIEIFVYSLLEHDLLYILVQVPPIGSMLLADIRIQNLPGPDRKSDCV